MAKSSLITPPTCPTKGYHRFEEKSKSAIGLTYAFPKGLLNWNVYFNIAT